MPGGDGTGPMGLGPMTGRAAGYCAGYPVPGYMNPIPGRGFGGRGRGFGRGRGWAARAAWGVPAAAPPGYGAAPYGWPQPTPEQEADALKGQAEFLQGQLDAIQKQLDELAKETAKD